MGNFWGGVTTVTEVLSRLDRLENAVFARPSILDEPIDGTGWAEAAFSDGVDPAHWDRPRLGDASIFRRHLNQRGGSKG